jgi:NAD(P)-dependent dehydrogenase (short-subunit alcohol dehydrogenase family)
MAKTALITGANRGIGQQLATVLANDGWDVLVGARDKQKGDAAAARLRKITGGRLKGVEIDVTSDASVATAAQKLRDGAIKIDALVNNAGVLRSAHTIETNFFGPLRVTLGLLPLVRDGGSITNVTSSLASGVDAATRKFLEDPALTRDGLIDFMRAKRWSGDDYAASKAALNALTKLFAAELAPRQIRVNATDPGWVRSDMGGRGAPRSIEEGAAAVLVGITTTDTGRIF